MESFPGQGLSEVLGALKWLHVHLKIKHAFPNIKVSQVSECSCEFVDLQTLNQQIDHLNKSTWIYRLLQSYFSFKEISEGFYDVGRSSRMGC